jgi:hypothetical protein
VFPFCQEAEVLKIREAAMTPALVAAIIQVISVFIFPFTDEQSGVLNAVVALIAAAVTAFSVAVEKGLAVLLGGANVLIQLVMAFGLTLTTAQQMAAATFATLLAGWLTRQNAVAPVAASGARVAPARASMAPITSQAGGTLH